MKEYIKKLLRENLLDEEYPPTYTFPVASIAKVYASSKLEPPKYVPHILFPFDVNFAKKEEVGIFV
jgi:hypothetical protein